MAALGEGLGGQKSDMGDRAIDWPSGVIGQSHWLGKVKGMGNGMDSQDLACCKKVATTGSSWVKGVGKQERWQERRWQWCEQEVLMNQLRAALSQLDQLWQALEPEPSLAKPSQH